MRAKWRLLVLLAYVLFLSWQFAEEFALSEGFAEFLFMMVFLLFALAPVAILCLAPLYERAMGIAALVVATFGFWAYHANDGDPIGLFILVFYQFCILGIAFLAIVIGATFLEKNS
ncbi:hypothetical protein [Erythrobacter sp. Alg231-14]|uniref:hypothetical protein n=1 Tax=Erythrobacter sp. Alg231-14 TaxID=1922225 RepID=UPI000D5599B3